MRGETIAKGRRGIVRVVVAGIIVPALTIARRSAALLSADPILLGLLRLADRDSTAHYLEAFTEGLREYGYINGQNLKLEERYADAKVERLPALAAELVNLKVRIIVATDTPTALAARQATTTIPIVFTTAADPVGTGLVRSLAHPGGNITGLSNITGDISPKHVELLAAVIPKLSLVALLANPANSSHRSIQRSVQSACAQARINSLTFEADTPEKIDIAFAGMSERHVGAVIVAIDSFFTQQRRQIASLALKYRVPSISSNAYYVDSEVPMLMSYGQDIADHWRRAASYCNKILKGAKAGDLPVEQSETLSLVINLKAAKQLGITIPYSVLVRANKLIE